MFGYVFNPLSLYFCENVAGELIAVLYEVSSTFGERHSYLAAVTPGVETVEQSAVKRMHVSPFLEMGLTYAFRIQPPGERIRVAIDTLDGEGVILAAELSRQAATSHRRGAALRLGDPSAADLQGHRRHPLGGGEAAAEGRAG